MRASCQGRSAPRPGLSAMTPCASPSDRPMAMPMVSTRKLPGFLIISVAAYVRRRRAASRRLRLRFRPKPDLGVDGFAALADLEIKLRLGAVAIVQGGDHIARRHPVADGLIEDL